MSLVKYNNNSISSITSAGQLASGSLVPISEQTASGSASISFTSGIDSTYPIYKFEFINCHPSNDSVNFKMNLSTDGGSNYNVTKTTTFFYASHAEADTEAQLAYDTGRDLAQGTADAHISNEVGNANDESLSGTMYLFNPSSSTYVKHFISEAQTYHGANLSIVNYLAGYGNTTSSINAVKFLFQTGNIDSGTIKLYGIKDS
jgi:hypothetical protein